MGHFGDWMESRWRTRGEYAMRAGAALRRVAPPLVARLAVPLLLAAGLFYVLGGPAREGANARRVEELRARIVAASDTLPEGALSSLEALTGAGVLSREETRFLVRRGIEYRPLGRGAPPEAIVFVARRGDTEYRYRKGGGRDHSRSWPSPDGRLAATSEPLRRPGSSGTAPPGAAARDGPRGKGRLLAIAGRSDGRPVGALPVAGSVLEVRWSPSGELLVASLSSSREGVPIGALDLALLEVTDGRVRELALPAAVRPEALLAPEDRGVRWNRYELRPVGWDGVGRLVLDAEGHGWLGDPSDPGVEHVALRYRFLLEIEGGRVRELERERNLYRKSRPNRRGSEAADFGDG